MSGKERLTTPEWLACATILSVLLYLTTLSYLSQPPDSLFEREEVHTTPEVSVTITGEVAFPGTYRLEKGTTLSEALDRAGLTHLSYTKRHKTTRKLKRSESIHIPTAQLITVEVSGEVPLPGSYLVPKGSKERDLYTLLGLPSDSSKKLSDGDTVHIPPKETT